MLYNLTPIDSCEVGLAGALAGAALVPLANPLTVFIPFGTVLDYGGAKFARLADDARVGDPDLVVDPLPTNLIAGDVANFGPEVGHALLPEGWAGKPVAWQNAQQSLAEYYLELTAPPYTGATADALTLAVVLQIGLQVEQGLGPIITKSASEGQPGAGITTAFRDRVVHPGAALIVFRETGKRITGFTVTAPGV
jgi:hypothetical protein